MFSVCFFLHLMYVTHPPTHPSTHSFIDSSFRPSIHSSMHNACTHTDTSVHPFISFSRPFICPVSFICPPIYPFFHVYVHLILISVPVDLPQCPMVNPCSNCSVYLPIWIWLFLFLIVCFLSIHLSVLCLPFHLSIHVCISSFIESVYPNLIYSSLHQPRVMCGASPFWVRIAAMSWPCMYVRGN